MLGGPPGIGCVWSGGGIDFPEAEEVPSPGWDSTSSPSAVKSPELNLQKENNTQMILGVIESFPIKNRSRKSFEVSKSCEGGFVSEEFWCRFAIQLAVNHRNECLCWNKKYFNFLLVRERKMVKANGFKLGKTYLLVSFESCSLFFHIFRFIKVEKKENS
jgi:hypothetical protein